MGRDDRGKQAGVMRGVLAEIADYLAFVGLLLFMVGVPAAIALIGTSR